MCGLLGYSLCRGEDPLPERAFAALERLAHRGPDARGTWQDNDAGVWLGHCRLKVVDLADRANQPLSYTSGNLKLIFNGELYNWRYLRSALEAIGHVFQTDSDSEVILASYREYGVDCLTRFNGMYAFAIFDGDAEQIFCARDPIGEKPFYYAARDNGVFFASEIPALVALLAEKMHPDNEAVSTMLLHNLRHIPDPRTGFKEVYSLRPGHAALIRRGEFVRMWRHWAPGGAANRTTEELRQQIISAVTERMQADIPVGLLLSGGFDSSCIASIMARAGTSSIRTYTLGYAESDEDIRRSRVVAESLGTVHREIFFDSHRVWKDFKAIIANSGSPVALLPLAYTLQLSQAMKQDGISVALTGHGADELFLGYSGQWQRAQLSKLLKWVPGISQLMRHAPGLSRALAAPAGARRAALYQQVAQNTFSDWIRSRNGMSAEPYIVSELAALGSLVPSQYYSDEASFTALILENQHSLTFAADFPAMQHGVELRCPFLDARLVEQVFQLPFSVRAPCMPAESKYFLRDLMRQFVPENLARLPKRGFGFAIQEADLFRTAWRQKCETVLLQMVPEFFEPQMVANTWQSFLAGDDQQAICIARLLAIGIWHQTFFGDASAIPE